MSNARPGAKRSEAVRERPRFYGLLYVDRSHNRHVNLRTGGDPVAVYAGCASLLAASARAAGESFTVLTNAAGELRSVARAHGFPDFDCAEIRFDLTLPPNTRFFHSHHKLCAIEAMGSGALGAFVGLLDIDAVLLRPLSPLFDAPTGLYAYGIDAGLACANLRDLDRLLGPAPGPRQWYGGEFIAGDAASLREVAAASRALLPRYLDALPDVVHVGEETLVSAALNRLREEGMPIANAGPARMVVRWYSSRLPVLQEPLARALDAAMLHLPTDKPYLQERARHRFTAEGFRRNLQRHVLAKALVRSLANPFLCLAQGERKFAPRLWGKPLVAGRPARARQAWS